MKQTRPIKELEGSPIMPTANADSASRKGFGKPAIDTAGRIRASIAAPIQAKR
ncbi:MULTISPECIES: hypothetical protein [Xanthobacter]|uniref:Uncharacterized protein n=1 Tax=Xanthobacter aminoxidans TaxID=186280 RepID=A0ABW6ZKL9_9HYPH|nr:hypothetical protein [Xanthobacter sp. 91]